MKFKLLFVSYYRENNLTMQLVRERNQSKNIHILDTVIFRLSGVLDIHYSDIEYRYSEFFFPNYQIIRYSVFEFKNTKKYDLLSLIYQNFIRLYSKNYINVLIFIRRANLSNLNLIFTIRQLITDEFNGFLKYLLSQKIYICFKTLKPF